MNNNRLEIFINAIYEIENLEEQRFDFLRDFYSQEYVCKFWNMTMSIIQMNIYDANILSHYIITFYTCIAGFFYDW